MPWLLLWVTPNEDYALGSRGQWHLPAAPVHGSRPRQSPRPCCLVELGAQVWEPLWMAF